MFASIPRVARQEGLPPAAASSRADPASRGRSDIGDHPRYRANGTARDVLSRATGDGGETCVSAAVASVRLLQKRRTSLVQRTDCPQSW